MKFNAYKLLTLLKALRDSAKKDLEKQKDNPLSWSNGFYKGHLEAYNFLIAALGQDLQDDILELTEVMNSLYETPGEE